MSGFEAAIRNALVRSSSGTADARQRVYAAARASLERNLARVNADEATATAQRQRLETTIDGIEGEWSGRPREPKPAPTMPAATAPPIPQPAGSPPVERTADVSSTNAGAAEVAETRGEVPSTAATEPSVASPAVSPSSLDVAPIDQPDLPDFARSTAKRASNEARLMEPPPDEITEPRRNRDPFFTASDTPAGTLPQHVGVATLDDPVPMPNVGGARDRSDREPSKGEPRVDPAADAPHFDAAADDFAVNDVVAAPALDEGERRTRKSATPKRAKSDRRQRHAAEKERRKEARRKRRPFRALAMLIVLAAIGAAHYWVSSEGLLEARDTNVDAITDVDERPQTAIEAASSSEWVSVFNVDDAAVSGVADIVEIDSEVAARVSGTAALALDGNALSSLGDRVRVAVELRAAREGQAIAFTCSGSLSCGRKRFVAPRELGELLFEVDVAPGGEPTLNVDPGIDGDAGTVEIMAIRAAAI